MNETQNQVQCDVVVYPGDGIGVDVTHAARAVLDAVEGKLGGYHIDYHEFEGGAAHYRDHGETLAPGSLEKAEQSDAIYLGAMGLPDVRYADGTEIRPQVDLRFHFDLYAGLRPVRAEKDGFKALAHPKAGDMDLILIRESTEGLFASMNSGVVIEDREARDTQVITRAVSEKLFHFGFTLARQRKSEGHEGKLTLVDKANIFTSFAFFRKIFDEVAEQYPDIATERLYVDACALDLVRRPWEFDVMVTENMFGDILSDLCAGLVGGMGFAPSGDIGDNYAVFQPAHGTAPDIAGQGKANPVAAIQSAAMMLDWLGRRKDCAEMVAGGRLIHQAVAAAINEKGLRSFDIGGSHGTEAATQMILDVIGEL